MNLRYEIESVRRKEILDIPEVALREAVVNAHCHRDYFEKGAHIMIEVYDDRVLISNPGGIPKGLDAKKFGQISFTRNPIIAAVLQRANYIEKMGTGITRIANAMKNADLPPAMFDTEGFFVVTLFRESNIKKMSGAKSGVKNGIKSGVKSVDENSGDSEIINAIRENGYVTIAQLVEIVKIPNRTLQRKILKLREKGIITRVGSVRAGIWKINEAD